MAAGSLPDVWNSIQADVSAGATCGGGLLVMRADMHEWGWSLEACCMFHSCTLTLACCACQGAQKRRRYWRAHRAGTLFKGFQRGHSTTYTLQAVLCQMLGSFGTLVSAKGPCLEEHCSDSLLTLTLYTCDGRDSADDASSACASIEGCVTLYH